MRILRMLLLNYAAKAANVYDILVSISNEVAKYYLRLIRYIRAIRS